MEFLNTQLGKLLEEVKGAMLAHIPVVYLPTDQLEVVQKLLYGVDSIDALVPRVCSRGEITRLGYMEIGEIDETNGMFKSITDNYKVGIPNPESMRVPSIIVSYTADWNSIANNVRTFIALYLGIKKSENQTAPQVTDAVRRSLYLVVTPKEEMIPAGIAPYVQTIRVPALGDDEIESIVLDRLRDEEIPEVVIDAHLLSQMIVSFRGFSACKIRQLLNRMIASECIGADGVNVGEVMNIIRSAKKQLLSNSQGLAWEKTTVSGVAGLDTITKWLNERKAIFADPELARRQYMDIPNGVLISGIPGSGKSLMAKTAATILDMPLISLDMGALLGGLMGESEHNMIRALAIAEQMAPCVLWIDEIEKAFSGSSQGASSSDGGVGRRMFGKFLTWMQEKSAACFVFATSNDISCLPPELFRSERFDRKFFTFMPTAKECAKIFAANIRAQNRAYQKEREFLKSSSRYEQAEQLFAPALEEETCWLKVIDECCTNEVDDCVLKNIYEGEKTENGEDRLPVYAWRTNSRPRNKLMTGADISALIKEAKFRIHPEPKVTNASTIYSEIHMVTAVRNILKGGEYKPYGETNLKDIVKCFLKLHENEFVPAGGKCIIDFDRYDTDRRLYMHDPEIDREWEHAYDKVLYYTIVGAINHYAKDLRTF